MAAAASCSMSQRHAVKKLNELLPERFIDDNYTNCGCQMHRFRCYSAGRSGGSRWDWDDKGNPNRRSRFSNAYETDECDEDNEFGFRNPTKQRVWWSDDVAEDDEEDEGFGIFEASIGFNWVFKPYCRYFKPLDGWFQQSPSHS